MATITLDLAGFEYSYTIAGPDVQRIIAAYQVSMPEATNQDVADLIVNSFVQSLIDKVFSAETEQAIEAARAGISPITITGGAVRVMKT